ncbi:MAG: glycosyltransferase family 4 protein [Bacteroidota bacterium]
MGGVAVVMRHADALAVRGHEVSVIEPTRPAGALRAVAVSARDRLHGVSGQRAHVAAHARVRRVRQVDTASVGTQDVVVATGYQTVPWVEALSRGCGRPVLFAQHDERVLNPRQSHRWWNTTMPRIAVSEWLCARLGDAGKPCLGVVPNAIDPSRFHVTSPLESRPEAVIALYHRHPAKGPETLVSALREIRSQRPAARPTVVSSRRPSHRLPEGVRILLRPSRDELVADLNRSSIVLHTAQLEGWGLFPMEAAACGCAVVATASLGPREYLRPDVSMVEVPVGDGEAIGREAVRLLAEPDRRIPLATSAVADVARFSWEASHDRFEQFLDRVVTEAP